MIGTFPLTLTLSHGGGEGILREIGRGSECNFLSP